MLLRDAGEERTAEVAFHATGREDADSAGTRRTEEAETPGTDFDAEEAAGLRFDFVGVALVR